MEAVRARVVGPPDADARALLALRLLPDEPSRALALLAGLEAEAALDDRLACRLEIVRLHHAARFGDRTEALRRVGAAEALACDREWIVEWLLIKLLVLFIAGLGTDTLDGLRELDAIRADAEAQLEPIELSWMDLMRAHFLGYIRGWAEVQRHAYDALSRLIDCGDAPPGLVANTKKNIGYSHLLVGNVDLARAYLEDAWRLYEPLPMTPRKLSAVKCWAQCLLTMGDAARAAGVTRPVAQAGAELSALMYASGLLLVAAEIELALGERERAQALLREAETAREAEVEPAALVHAAYVRALLLAERDPAAAAAAAFAGCARIAAHSHEIAVQGCLDLAARLAARTGDFQRAWSLQCRLVEMRADLARKAAEIRHIDLHVGLQTRLEQLATAHAQREREMAAAAEAAILERNALLEQRLREVEHLQESLREQANRDALTGLYNRRYLAEALPGLLSRCAREGERIALVLMDLDHFKQVNDRHGHQMGDAVLRGFAELLQDSFRAHDLCCRWGGEEFCVLMAATDEKAARARVEELLQALAARVFSNGPRRLANVGFSAGVVVFRADPRVDMDAVFRRVDQALYAAKQAGRRRIALLEEA